MPITLRPFSSLDTARVCELCQDPQISMWTTVPNPYTLEDAEYYIRDYTSVAWREINTKTYTTETEGPELVWAVWVADGPLEGLWGSIGLKRHGDRKVDVGYWLGAGARGNGIMPAAVRSVIEAAFHPRLPIQATSMWWYAFEGNKSSAFVAERVGMKYMGLTRSPYCGDRDVMSAVIYPDDPRRSRDDWPDLGFDD
jgi:RimJ/RimL family protein N-acetyltransferase